MNNPPNHHERVEECCWRCYYLICHIQKKRNGMAFTCAHPIIDKKGTEPNCVCDFFSTDAPEEEV